MKDYLPTQWDLPDRLSPVLQVSLTLPTFVSLIFGQIYHLLT